MTTALEWLYLAGETDVRAEWLKSAAEPLVLRHDMLKLIEGAGPDAPAPYCAGHNIYKEQEQNEHCRNPGCHRSLLGRL